MSEASARAILRERASACEVRIPGVCIGRPLNAHPSLSPSGARLRIMPPKPLSQGVRLARLTRRLGSDDCWPWLGSVKANGYGQLKPDGAANGYAHRIAYEEAYGPIPAGMTVDHLCHTKECFAGCACEHRRCVNPAHLTLATRVDNWRRTAGKSHCRKGHDYAELGRLATGACVRCAQITQHSFGVRRQDSRGADLRRRVPLTVVAEIREKHAGGTRQVDLCREYGLSSQQVSRITMGRKSARGRTVARVSAEVRLAVHERDNWRCLRCGAPPGRYVSVHHRVPRGMAGSRDPASSGFANLISLCGSATTGCHGWVESNRTLATEQGWLVRHGTDPADIPLTLFDGRVVQLVRDQPAFEDAGA